MSIIRILEEMANVPNLEHKVHEVVKENKLIQAALKKNNINDIKKLLSPCEHYPNEVYVAHY